MMQDETPLAGVVEADETYIGGKTDPSESRADRRRSPARGFDWRANKTVVLAAVERGGNVRLRVADDVKRKTVKGLLDAVVSPDAEALYTDELRSYDGLPKHESVNHSANEWVRGLVHSNTAESVFSLFDRGVIGSYHKLSVKHLPAYLDEFAFRWNNRENPHLFRDAILRLVEADALTYEELTAPAS